MQYPKTLQPTCTYVITKGQIASLYFVVNSKSTSIPFLAAGPQTYALKKGVRIVNWSLHGGVVKTKVRRKLLAIGEQAIGMEQLFSEVHAHLCHRC